MVVVAVGGAILPLFWVAAGSALPEAGDVTVAAGVGIGPDIVVVFVVEAEGLLMAVVAAPLVAIIGPGGCEYGGIGFRAAAAAAAAAA